MTERYYQYILTKKHRANRREVQKDFAAEMQGLPYGERVVSRFEQLMALEVPHIEEDEIIVFTRTNGKPSDVLTPAEWEEYKEKYGHVHELGYTSNLCGNYTPILQKGLLAFRDEKNPLLCREIDAIIGLADRYAAEAERIGRTDVAEVLKQVPRYPARSFREALQCFRIIHFSLWMEGCYHNTVGLFDRYMFPYFDADIKSGKETESSAYELLCDFFLSFNKDSDLYPGQQQGDNGQSMVLGGCDAAGNDCFNKLSELCLQASGRLLMIDPKINLRVSKKTPFEVFLKGSKLTAAGLGFPQYNNDDVVIPALEAFGYSHEDACNYVVAACWEFIIPGCGYEIVNLSAVNFPAAVDEAVHKYLPACKDFDAFLEKATGCLKALAQKKAELTKVAPFLPSPLYDMLIPEKRYRNFGFHGTGIASAADALAAIRTHVFEKKDVTPERLIAGLDSNYEQDAELLRLMRYESPKMGCDQEEADGMAAALLDAFADALKGKKNAYGGIYRPGTGTAMFYLWHAAKVGATADGRRNGESYGTNFSPNLFVKTPGPVSVIRSFSPSNVGRVCNGGPLTLEFAASALKAPDSLQKLAGLVQYFIHQGGHQMQLNTVFAEKMREAQIHPENYGQLVVRIWGWSAYFVELDKPFQDHVIARQEHSVG